MQWQCQLLCSNFGSIANILPEFQYNAIRGFGSTQFQIPEEDLPQIVSTWSVKHSTNQ
jgi:hypothetical protein